MLLVHLRPGSKATPHATFIFFDMTLAKRYNRLFINVLSLNNSSRPGDYPLSFLHSPV